MSKNLKESVYYAARLVAAEWIESVGAIDALTMVELTREAITEGGFLPEPAQLAEDSLYIYMTEKEVEKYFPIMLDFIEQQIKLYINNNQ